MPPTIVIDTNVLIAALSSARGASYKLLSLVGTGTFNIALSVPLLVEYEDVSHRLVTIPKADIQATLEYLIAVGELCEIFFLWRPLLDDPKDDMLLEIALRSGATVIVTFNKRHLKPAKQLGIRPLTPIEFLKEIGAVP